MLVQKPIAIQLVMTLSAFVKPRSSLLFSQEFASEPYNEADESNHHPDNLFFKVMVDILVMVVVVVVVVLVVFIIIIIIVVIISICARNKDFCLYFQNFYTVFY